MNKKKSLNILYIFLLGLACVIYFGNSSVNAMTIEELQPVMEDFSDFLSEKGQNTNFLTEWNNNKSSLNNKINDYNYFAVCYNTWNNYYILFFDDNIIDHVFKYSSGIRIYNPNNYNIQYTNFRIRQNDFLADNESLGHPFADFSSIPYFTTNFDVYTDNTFTTLYTGDNYYVSSITPQSTITLTTPLTSFHKFQGIGDKQQCNVMLTGSYEIDMFNFFIQKYSNNEWETITGTNDYYLLYDQENDTIFSNPYYVLWHNISYLDVGTYRFIATGTTEQTEFSTNSNSFEVTQWEIISSGNATGTIDSSGNVSIDVNIDNGNLATGIIDYLGQEPNDPNGDIDREVEKTRTELENKLNNDKFMKSLQQAEKGFLDILNEPEGDFIISWDNIYYMNTILIPAKSINFSKLCRDNQTLAQIKSYINTIISFGIAIEIIKYIYNLILSTLGIDNPYLYEQNEDQSTIFADMDTGEITGRQIVHRSKNGRIVYRGKGGGN